MLAVMSVKSGLRSNGGLQLEPQGFSFFTARLQLLPRNSNFLPIFLEFSVKTTIFAPNICINYE